MLPWRDSGREKNKSDSIVTDVYYQWEESAYPGSSLFNGNLRIYVSQISKSAFKWSYDFGYVDGYYDIWVFDAWTGEFVERKKVEAR